MAILRFPGSRQGVPTSTQVPGGEGRTTAGDSSFARVCKDLKPVLRRRLQRQLGNIDAAEDAVQETFLRMLRYRAMGDAGEVRALMFRVATSVMVDRQRYATTRHANDHCSLDDQDLVSDEPQPDRNLATRQDLDILQRAILALPPRCREVFLLHRFEGLSYRDIARRFGTSERTIENQIAHALAVCRRALT